MRKHSLIMLAAGLLGFAACTGELEDRVTSLENRLDKLEALVNDNVNSIKALVEANAKAVTINSVTTTDNGYVIKFSDGTTATIANGQDGAPGQDGKDAAAPQIGVQEIDGVLYWTVNGELLKFNGENIRVTGNDGQDGAPGQDGQDGKDGITPQFKVEEGKWYISFDGEVWSEVGSAVTEVKSVVTVETTDEAYIFHIDDTTISIPKTNAFSLKLDQNDSIELKAGERIMLTYNIVGEDETTHVAVESSNFKAELDEYTKTLFITAPAEPVDGYVLIKATRNSDGAHSAQHITFHIQDTVYGMFGGEITNGEDIYVEW
ncbi:MAG: PL29 family lyase N-terminal domain-containing protein [Bacteroidales bacterium]|nr:PL29 family lyase N-terminal domain-containing protein [Bacteroidales bacterium]MDY5262691.1 PL29 family lyase N-terminal domain-containing protein [Candidatus Cryptobacteroides sp.]MDY5570592.1 PL29 family lyase N-terminal domain-containing protein [Candidatus Cryptobacteroides sp.]